MKVIIESIRDQESRLENRKEQYLIERGWKESCDFPDSRWRWVKVFGRGCPLSVGREEAVRIQADFGEDTE